MHGCSCCHLDYLNLVISLSWRVKKLYSIYFSHVNCFGDEVFFLSEQSAISYYGRPSVLEICIKTKFFFLNYTINTTYKLTTEANIFIPWHVCFPTVSFSSQSPKILQPKFNTIKQI